MAQIITFPAPASQHETNRAWDEYSALKRAIATEPGLTDDPEVKALIEAKRIKFERLYNGSAK